MSFALSHCCLVDGGTLFHFAIRLNSTLLLVFQSVTEPAIMSCGSRLTPRSSDPGLCCCLSDGGMLRLLVWSCLATSRSATALSDQHVATFLFAPAFVWPSCHSCVRCCSVTVVKTSGFIYKVHWRGLARPGSAMAQDPPSSVV